MYEQLIKDRSAQILFLSKNSHTIKKKMNDNINMVSTIAWSMNGIEGLTL